MNIRIRTRLFIIYMTVFVVILLSHGIAQYYLIEKTIRGGIKNEMKNTTQIILGMVEATTDAAIRSYLRAIAEKNLEIVKGLYGKYRRGEISEGEAWSRTIEVLSSQRIGRTGYIYCINTKGIMNIHPKKSLIGSDLSGFQFAQRQMKEKEGYILYEWKNPGEEKEKPKALYMTYFAPWDMIISVSSYRDEFSNLVRVEDFKEKVLSLKFGDTGYSYIIDIKGNVVIHPHITGNYLNAVSSDGNEFVKEMVEKKSGEIFYSWKNPGETTARDKLVIYNYIPELNWIVASSSYIDEFYKPLVTLRWIFMAGFFVTMSIIALINLALSGYITAPIKAIVQKLKIAHSGDYSVRMGETGAAEIGEMSHYFNIFIEGLIESKKKDEQIIRIQKMEAMWQLSSGLAHDFNNMLAGIMGSVTLLQLYAQDGFAGKDEKIRNLLDIIENAAIRASEMVNRLLLMSRKSEIKMVPVDLILSVKNVMGICSGTFDKQVEINVNYSEEKLFVMADPTQLEQVILNLCINAEQSMTFMRESSGEWGGTLTVSFNRIAGDEYLCGMYPQARMVNYIVLEISDTGVGMNNEILSRIFDPFFSTKDAGRGTGLGLSIVYTIVSQLGGFVSVYSQPGEGTSFRIFLPEITSAAGAADLRRESRDDLTGSGLILVIDDEEIIRNTSKAILTGYGYTVITAEGGEEGLSLFIDNMDEIKAVVLDMTMPGMNGKEVFAEMKKIKPDVRVILSSGMHRNGYVSKVLETGVFDFLHKPYSMEILLSKVSKAINS